jgi:hypothetical protein
MWSSVKDCVVRRGLKMKTYKVTFSREYQVEAADDSDAIEKCYPMLYSDVGDEAVENNVWITHIKEVTE